MILAVIKRDILDSDECFLLKMGLVERPEKLFLKSKQIKQAI
jgi:hypothetical protein